jgi:myo-inositol-1(or 4)-monophosphatase
MTAVDEFLELSKSVANQAGLRLLGFTQERKSYAYSGDHPRELKALADTILERDILEALAPTGLAILSEESGYIPSQQKSEYWFIVDPLDGTFNFIKGLGPSAVSIALWQDRRPIFGVIYSVSERELVWGGSGMGAYAGGRQISVAATSNQAQASLCTGFPVRFDVESDGARQNFWRLVRSYAKVRMLGSAAVSLLHVARGSADVYSERDIMLWDVAAGLAIVEGAGGRGLMTETNRPWCYEVFAANAHLCPISEIETKPLSAPDPSKDAI